MCHEFGLEVKSLTRKIKPNRMRIPLKFGQESSSDGKFLKICHHHMLYIERLDPIRIHAEKSLTVMTPYEQAL